MAVLPDTLYQKQPEALQAYSDARFNSLLANLPDYYPSPNDYSLYGCLLRVLAMELARIEYMYSNDLVGLEPQYLTPPDIKRRWADALFISKSYPNNTQSDMEYQQMLVALLRAYPGGATAAVIEQIIEAYTGQNIPVLELYKLIGNGIYDETDRNTLKVTFDATAPMGQSPFTGTISAAALATLSQNLYAAIDLAKPAHIGLDFTITFGSGEDLTSHTLGIMDLLEIIYYGVENAPVPVVFTDSPYKDSSSPDTRLNTVGLLAPELNRGWEIKSDELVIYRLS